MNAVDIIKHSKASYIKMNHIESAMRIKETS